VLEVVFYGLEAGLVQGRTREGRALSLARVVHVFMRDVVGGCGVFVEGAVSASEVLPRARSRLGTLIIILESLLPLRPLLPECFGHLTFPLPALLLEDLLLRIHVVVVAAHY
jgi:hypothetical protein